MDLSKQSRAECGIWSKPPEKAKSRLLKILFKNTERYMHYAKKNEYMNTMVANFQFRLMQQHFLRMKTENSCWTCHQTIHSWIWAILKKVSKMKPAGRDRLYIKMIGDYKRFSLNPLARKDPERAVEDHPLAAAEAPAQG